MRPILVVVVTLMSGCALTGSNNEPRHQAGLRDIESYAIASCLYNQEQPYLKDQGDAWASAVVQRTKINIEALASVANEVKAEVQKGDMAFIRNEVMPQKDKSVPVLYCYEITDKPSVKSAIRKAISAQ